MDITYKRKAFNKLNMLKGYSELLQDTQKLDVWGITPIISSKPGECHQEISIGHDIIIAM